jgi:hypothetical protein
MLTIGCREGCRIVVVVLALAASSSAALLDFGAMAPHGRIGYQFERIERIEHSETGSIRPEYDWGRLAATCHLVSLGVAPNSNSYVGVIIGPAMYQVHNGEGETVEYDSICMGFAGNYQVSLWAPYDLGFYVSSRLLVSSSDDGEITEVARDEVTEFGSSKLSWSEISLMAALTQGYGALRLMAGIEYVRWDIEQEWTFSIDSARDTVSVEPDTSVGLVLGAGLQITDDLALNVGVKMGHQTSFQSGITFTF